MCVIIAYLKEVRMVNFPKLKKRITAFLVKEDGKISKKTLMSIGVVATTLAFAGSVNADSTYSPDCAGITAPDNSQAHDNSLSLSVEEEVALATHNHCVETHSSHSSGGGGGGM